MKVHFFRFVVAVGIIGLLFLEANKIHGWFSSHTPLLAGIRLVLLGVFIVSLFYIFYLRRKGKDS